eukprot:TRINITY_DN6651_c0_g1_i2.p1 TRINITY_DN6651_c0_g1~~TRINITY_DN6651_c0_g1_i2.p1  ORF type:complete len:981 (+),score=204.87 TRINITY_DN6651_c0_g1_i2:24-2945(+)
MSEDPQENVMNESETIIEETEQDPTLTRLINERKERKERRDFIASVREQQSDISYPARAYFKKLDSNLKKNSAFTKRIATLNPENEASLLKDLNTLNLTKFIEEVVKGIINAPLRNSHIGSAVRICCQLNLIYRDFLEILLSDLINTLEDPEAPFQRKVILLRLLSELHVHGLWEEETSIVDFLQKFLKSQPPKHSLPLVLNFIKHYREFLLGMPYPDNPDEELLVLCSDPGIKELRNTIDEYYEKSLIFLEEQHQKLSKCEQKNREILIAKGELDPQTQENYSKIRGNYEKVVNNISTLAEYLQKETPKIIEMNLTRMNAETDNQNDEDVEELPLWEDEQTRAFYEDLVDLTSEVNPELLTSNKIVDNEKDPSNKKFKKFLATVKNRVNRDLADQYVVKFVKMFNTKPNRKKLTQALLDVPRTRLDMLPPYSRLVATLHPYIPDIGNTMVKDLVNEFGVLYEEKDQLKIESKIKNIHYLSELVKFNVCPPDVIFNCFKQCLDDFKYHNIEITCALLECCGRFLYRTPATRVKTDSFVERMRRLKDMKNLDQYQSIKIENAYYSTKPPKRETVEVVELSPVELYIRKLVYNDLKEKNVKVVLKKLRKLDWSNEDFILHVLLKFYKTNYSNIHLVAYLVTCLSKFHNTFAVKFVDALVEKIVKGLEEMNYLKHQKLIINLKFLAELYMYDQVNSLLILTILYYMIGLGQIKSIKAIEADSPKDLFRIRLICTLLNTCGKHLLKEDTDELHKFLFHFQQYVCRKQLFSPDIAQMIEDTYDDLKSENKRWELSTRIKTAINLKDDYLESDSSSEESSSESVDQELLRRQAAKRREKEILRDFNSEYEKVMSERADTVGKKTIIPVKSEITIPMMKKRTASPENERPSSPDKKKFSLMLRGGNKPKFSSISIPSSSKFVTHHDNSVSNTAEDNQDIKRTVLRLDQEDREQRMKEKLSVGLHQGKIVIGTPYTPNGRN